MLNDALFYQPYEIIEGEKILSAPAYLNHSGIIMNLSNKIFNYVVANKCGYVFTDNVDVHFPDGSLFRPDLTVITKENKKIMNWKGSINGVKEYFKYDADEWEEIDEEEKAAYKPEIKVSIFDDLFIKVDDIFSWGYED